MTEATFELPNGTIISIKGSNDEVKDILDYYLTRSDEGERKETSKSTQVQKVAKDQKPEKTTTPDLASVANQIKNCPEARSIEKNILDTTSEVNRVLLPLYVVYEYLDNAFPLTTGQISKITSELGIKFSRQNVLRSLTNAGKSYVSTDEIRKHGRPSKYRLNPRGAKYMKSVIGDKVIDEPKPQKTHQRKTKKVKKVSGKIMNVFRIHLRPKGGSANMETTFDYCLKNRILGVGWRTKTNDNTKDWNEYFQEASEIHKNLNICKYIKKWIREGDLVWTRDAIGHYYLAMVTSGWEYWVGNDAKKLDIDIANIFRVKFRKIEIDAVPGKTIASFRARRTIQKISCEKVREYSKYLWNLISDKPTYTIDKSKFSDIFMLLDDEETEDLVFLYLQSRGWYVIPNSRKGDTMSFEYLMTNPETGEKALTQVKTGNASIDKDRYEQYSQKIFLFQSNDLYSGVGSRNMVSISRTELSDFLNESLAWLPKTFQNKVKILKP